MGHAETPEARCRHGLEEAYRSVTRSAEPCSMPRTSKPAGEVKEGSPTKGRCDSILRNEANPKARIRWISTSYSVSPTPLEAQQSPDPAR
jgi:hypothetical protein